MHPDQSRIICSSDRSDSAAILFPVPANLKSREGGVEGTTVSRSTEDGSASKQTVSPLPRSHQLVLHLALLSRHTGLFSISPVFFLMHSSFSRLNCQLPFCHHIVLHILSDQNLGLSLNLPLDHCPPQGWTSWRGGRSKFLCRLATALLLALCWPPGCGQG